MQKFVLFRKINRRIFNNKFKGIDGIVEKIKLVS